MSLLSTEAHGHGFLLKNFRPKGLRTTLNSDVEASNVTIESLARPSGHIWLDNGARPAGRVSDAGQLHRSLTKFQKNTGRGKVFCPKRKGHLHQSLRENRWLDTDSGSTQQPRLQDEVDSCSKELYCPKASQLQVVRVTPKLQSVGEGNSREYEAA
ncbi:unnamed protein product [Fusarium venenatum]|uniref:Uncharacterized protein n=1 Tax=Fusarium venenatum TaxID=56646 RepID=A0A2L2T7L7_9HYPO|nr:uncharacterized protein FVRRES_03376 [Fusarium venenatum]CEI66864.1 unnamed protein product [Fusarium venenatum]